LIADAKGACGNRTTAKKDVGSEEFSCDTGASFRAEHFDTDFLRSSKMTFLIVRSAVIAAALFDGFLQMPSTPPMRMGLWQTDATTTMVVPNMPAGMPGMGPLKTQVTSCMTPESYAKNLAAANQQKNCVRSNESWTAGEYKADVSCNNGKTTGHFDMLFDSKDSAHGSVHMASGSGRGGVTIDQTMDMKFLSSDCGSVTPDNPVISH
jgi:hypothetical protein